ncbi:hypothetical protein [Chitinophaga filiformis]|uniref:Uncharacterized protein n=1 Tax=Chitinophaga filiformis TaxID=104663 RepID=A0ABY4I970_CHIFI|nr:hypothetical protein [Chitinophaga filiformis]UPK72208.1 hypothetical protein MYF79_13020 [Chitinophaga filiformis]
MKSDITASKNKALVFTPATILAMIYLMMLICMLLLMVLGEEMGDTFYALLLFMPCVICSLLLDVFLRILFRKDVKYKALYVWLIEIAAMVIGIRLFLLA